jgi:hypothetical protein
MIIEIVGIPGSGKSSLLNQFLIKSRKLYPNRVVKIISHDFLYGYRSFSKKIILFIKVLLKLKFDFLKIIYLIFKFHFEFKRHVYFFKIIFKNILKLIIIDNNNDSELIYLIDEGLLHACSTPLFKKNLNYNFKIYKIILEIPTIKKLLKNVTYIKIESNFDKCIIRIKERYQNIPNLYKNLVDSDIKTLMISQSIMIDYFFSSYNSDQVFRISNFNVNESGFFEKLNSLIYNRTTLHENKKNSY